MKHEELTIENECRQLARRSGWVCCKLEKNGHKGIPDDLFIAPDGRHVYLVEFKKGAGERLRPEQERWRARFPEIFRKIDSVDGMRELLEMENRQEKT